MEVKLIKTLNPEQMPIGLTGVILDVNPNEHGMILVEFGNGVTMPMYRDELEPSTINHTGG